MPVICASCVVWPMLWNWQVKLICHYVTRALCLVSLWGWFCKHNVSLWVKGQVWLRGRASVLNSPILHVEVTLGKILNPRLLLMCWSPPCMAATAISVCMYVWTWTKAFEKFPTCKCKAIYWPWQLMKSCVLKYFHSMLLHTCAIHWKPQYSLYIM